MSDLLFYLHIGSLCVAGVGILLADSEAFSWLRGKQEVIIGMQSRVAHWTVTLGLAGLTLSGLALFWPMRDYLIGDPLFWIKMALVFALLINGIVIESLMPIAARRSFRSLTTREKLPLMVSGAVSTACWIGAGIVALILF